MVAEVSGDTLRAVREAYGVDHPLSRTAFDARVETLAAQERQNPTPVDALWWLSFADAERGFLGVAIVAADGPTIAMQRAWDLGINPGGEVRSILVPADTVPDRFRNRLLTRDEAEQLNEFNRDRG